MIATEPFKRFTLNTTEAVPQEVLDRRARFAAGPMAHRLGLSEGSQDLPSTLSPEGVAEAFGRAAFAAYGRDWPKLIDIARGAAIQAHGDAMGEVK